jgi:hypothetical protein
MAFSGTSAAGPWPRAQQTSCDLILQLWRPSGPTYAAGCGVAAWVPSACWFSTGADLRGCGCQCYRAPYLRTRDGFSLCGGPSAARTLPFSSLCSSWTGERGCLMRRSIRHSCMTCCMVFAWAMYLCHLFLQMTAGTRCAAQPPG